MRKEIYEFLRRHKYSSETKTVLLMAYVDIALEHHESGFLLIKSKFYGSAFALIRPLFDTMFRALWLNACATLDQIKRVESCDNAKFPKMVDMVAAIDQSYSTDTFFASIKEASWTAMCSYAHSGLLQITRRFTGNEVKPNYQDAEVFQALNAANGAIILLSRMFFMSVGAESEAKEVEKMASKYAAT